MIKKLLIIPLMLILIDMSGQSKRDYNWILGHKADDLPYGLIINFEGERSFTSVVIQELMGANNTIISTEDGELLFYSNGCRLFNSEHQVIEGSDGINAPGWVYREFCEEEGGLTYYPIGWSSIILPDPGNEDGYYYIHRRDSVDFENSEFYANIFESYVDFSEDELGRLLYKQKEILPLGQYASGYTTACKHANGRDWWLIFRDEYLGIYYNVLLNEEGFSVMDTIDLGEGDLVPESYGGQAVFSPDGSLYATHSYEGLYLYDFDRETGRLSNNRKYVLDDYELHGSPYGAAFSASGRFVYCTSQSDLYQVDLWNEGTEDMVVHIDSAIHFGNWPGPPHYLARMMRAPDCKIYMSVGNGDYYMHTIHHPDEKGKDCYLEQNIQLPTSNGINSMPNWPHFRIDEEEPCDPTITSVTDLPIHEDPYYLKIYPNPTSDKIFISQPITAYRIHDMSGKEVKREERRSSFSEIDLSEFRTGMYSVRMIGQDGKYYSRKVVVE